MFSKMLIVSTFWKGFIPFDSALIVTSGRRLSGMVFIVLATKKRETEQK